MPTERLATAAISLPFDEFWTWLRAHRNCILRAGTPYCTMMDHDDYHWDVLDEDEMQILQLARGKDLVGEIVVLGPEISEVVCPHTEGDDQLFECVVEGSGAKDVMYYFLLSHGYEEESPQSRAWTH